MFLMTSLLWQCSSFLVVIITALDCGILLTYVGGTLRRPSYCYNSDSSFSLSFYCYFRERLCLLAAPILMVFKEKRSTAHIRVGLWPIWSFKCHLHYRNPPWLFNAGIQSGFFSFFNLPRTLNSLYSVQRKKISICLPMQLLCAMHPNILIS